MASETEFKYVLIPADEALPLKEFSAVPMVMGDTLVEVLKAHFAGGSLTNMGELRLQYGSKIDDKMAELKAAGNKGVVEVLPLVRNSRSTLPNPCTQTALYYDEMGSLKDKPSNTRASALAKQCGLDLEHPLPGDVFVGRVCCDPGPVSVSIEKHEFDSSSPWIRQAPSENAMWKGVLEDFSDVAKSKAIGAKTVEEEEAENVSRGWRWSQTESDVEVLVALPEGTTKDGISVVINRSSLRIILKANSSKPLLDIRKLYFPVNTDESTWVMGSDAKGPHVQVTLEKEQEQTWPYIEAKNM
jgi:hypothetical protein